MNLRGQPQSVIGNDLTVSQISETHKLLSVERRHFWISQLIRCCQMMSLDRKLFAYQSASLVVYKKYSVILLSLNIRLLKSFQYLTNNFSNLMRKVLNLNLMLMMVENWRRVKIEVNLLNLNKNP